MLGLGKHSKIGGGGWGGGPGLDQTGLDRTEPDQTGPDACYAIWWLAYLSTLGSLPGKYIPEVDVY